MTHKTYTAYTTSPPIVNFTYRGLHCSISLNSLGAWCGYVNYPDSRIPKSIIKNMKVHGGVTYCSGGRAGFDCCHGDDYVPGIHGTTTMQELSKYRSRDYARAHVKILADQIADLLADQDAYLSSQL